MEGAALTGEGSGTARAQRPEVSSGVRRMRRAERREQILASVTAAVSRNGGFAATSLDDLAAEAGVTRMILYRHFESKADLFQNALARESERLHEATTDGGALVEDSLARLVAWAAREPDAFRLLFRYAPQEPGFCRDVRELRAGMSATVRQHTVEELGDGAWAAWGTRMAVTVVIEGVLEWLDLEGSDVDRATDRIGGLIESVLAPCQQH